jgi:hypothetical protein
MVSCKLKMPEFVVGGCRATQDAKKFVADWLKTAGNPCSVCGNDRSNCSFYKELLDSGDISVLVKARSKE